MKLRVEIELLQVDHDADREILLTWTKAERTGPSGIGIETMLATMGNAEAIKSIEEGQKLVAKAEEKGEDAEAIGRRVLAEAMKNQLDPIRKNYAKQAAELAEKRLQLDATEKQYFKDE